MSEFDTIWSEYHNSLKAFVGSRVENNDSVMDILQEVAMKLHQKLSSTERVKNPKTWLFQVTRNTISDFYRAHYYQEEKKNSIPTDSLLEQSSSTCYCDLAEFVIHHYLPETDSKPLILSDFEKIPQSEIAEELGLSLTATKSRIQRARQKLKALITSCVQIQFNSRHEMVGFELRADCELPEELKAEIENLKINI